MSKVRNFLTSRDGATAVEYGIVVAVICGMLIVAFTLLSDSLSSLFTYISGFLNG
jgi:Flp pilus assembly pilin Flp